MVPIHFLPRVSDYVTAVMSGVTALYVLAVLLLNLKMTALVEYLNLVLQDIGIMIIIWQPFTGSATLFRYRFLRC